MLRYMLVMLLYAITYCMASDNETDISANGLEDSTQMSLSNTNESLTTGQQIYHYAPSNMNENLTLEQQNYNMESYQGKMQLSSNLLQILGSGYLITPGMGAHKFHARVLPWNKARRICIQERGHLAVINSISEEKILLQIMKENQIVDAWLGVHDLYEEGDWNTIMDEPLEATGYSKWRPGEPNNYKGIEHCGTIQTPEGGINDRGCTEQIGFFCEIAL